VVEINAKGKFRNALLRAINLKMELKKGIKGNNKKRIYELKYKNLLTRRKTKNFGFAKTEEKNQE
jgi:hypothetical protein